VKAKAIEAAVRANMRWRWAGRVDTSPGCSTKKSWAAQAMIALRLNVGRPSNIPACLRGANKEKRYLLPTYAASGFECLAMTEPAAGLGYARHENDGGRG